MSAWVRLQQVLFGLMMIAVLAGIVHIVSLLVMPRFASQDAYHLLIAQDSASKIRLIDEALRSKMVEDPAIVAAACPYDLNDGPLRIGVAPLAQEFLSISFHPTRGPAFFALTDRAAAKAEIDMLLVTQDQLQAIEGEDDPEEPITELRLVAPEQKGFVFVRSLVRRPGERAEAERRVLSVGCEIDKSEMPDN